MAQSCHLELAIAQPLSGLMDTFGQREQIRSSYFKKILLLGSTVPGARASI